MQRIFKYDLIIRDKQFIEVPQYTKPLKIAFQYEMLKMWCQVTPSRPSVLYTIYIFGTGQEIPNIAMEYLDTVVDHRGLVWHVYLGIYQ